jgi:hypothetical protein
LGWNGGRKMPCRRVISLIAASLVVVRLAGREAAAKPVRALVGRVVHSAGYNLLSFTRASAVVNCQFALACFLLRSASHASTSSFNTR